jgi:3-oxoacyl-[acyl-carrier-protein] synthase II
VAGAQRQGKPLAAHYGRQPSSLCIGIGLELFSMPDMVTWLAAGADARPPLQADPDFLQPAADRCPHHITQLHGLTRWPQLHISACAASTDAIGRAFRQVRAGRLAWALAGGADSMFNPMGIAGFCKIQAMTTRNDAPAQASRPFDRRRDGFLIGEGAALLVLETLDGALQRGAPVLAELLGYGNSFDAHGISEPHPAGAGALLAMQRALQDARLSPESIVQVNAHGTSTPKNDPAETSALRQLFAATHGESLAGLPVNATKSMIGHLIAASGAVEVAAQIVCGNAGWVHPTINLDEPAADCQLDHVRGAPRPARPGPLLKNSFAFGGQNASLVLQPTC